MLDEMANHGSRVRRYIEEVGHDEVESFIVICKGSWISILWNIDRI
jgi:spore cortex formation protein SpoVR/YcgB (stage V sporulation)